jgi:hypothetical protein
VLLLLQAVYVYRVHPKTCHFTQHSCDFFAQNQFSFTVASMNCLPHVTSWQLSASLPHDFSHQQRDLVISTQTQKLFISYHHPPQFSRSRSVDAINNLRIYFLQSYIQNPYTVTSLAHLHRKTAILDNFAPEANA